MFGDEAISKHPKVRQKDIRFFTRRNAGFTHIHETGNIIFELAMILSG